MDHVGKTLQRDALDVRESGIVKGRIYTDVTRAVTQQEVVKREMSLGAKLEIYRLMYPRLWSQALGHEE